LDPDPELDPELDLDLDLDLDPDLDPDLIGSESVSTRRALTTAVDKDDNN
jgi:hypothetical protein